MELVRTHLQKVANWLLQWLNVKNVVCTLVMAVIVYVMNANTIRITG